MACRRTYIVRTLLQDPVATASGGVARDLATDLRDSVKSCSRQMGLEFICFLALWLCFIHYVPPILAIVECDERGYRDEKDKNR
jgi:hypothetical protein